MSADNDQGELGGAKILTVTALAAAFLLIVVGLIAVVGPQNYPPGTRTEYEPIVLYRVPELRQENERDGPLYDHRLHF